MRKRPLLVFAVIMLLLPLQAFAAVCFRSQGVSVGGRTDDVRVILVNPGPSEGFFSLVGEAIRTSCAPSESAPLTGSAHLQSPNGPAHFSVFIGGTASCFPIILQGILHPPTFNAGTGTLDVPSNDTFDDADFFPIPCPPLPQSAGTGNPDR